MDVALYAYPSIASAAQLSFLGQATMTSSSLAAYSDFASKLSASAFNFNV